MTKEKFFEATELNKKIEHTQRIISILCNGNGKTQIRNNTTDVEITEDEANAMTTALAQYRESLVKEFEGI